MTAPVHPLPPLREHGYAGTTGERLLATAPPPVRVVRLAGDHPAVRGPWAMAQAVEAAAIGATTVEYITHGGNGYPTTMARELATIAARHARLALGASR